MSDAKTFNERSNHSSLQHKTITTVRGSFVLLELSYTEELELSRMKCLNNRTVCLCNMYFDKIQDAAF